MTRDFKSRARARRAEQTFARRPAGYRYQRRRFCLARRRSKSNRFDVAIVDFPDPNNFALGKLYTTRFYNLLKAKLKPDSAVVIQTHLAADRPKLLLVHHQNARSRRLYRQTVSRRPFRASASGALRWPNSSRSKRRRSRRKTSS